MKKKLLRCFLLSLFLIPPQGFCMPSLPKRSQLDALNQHCYDNCYQLWDRFPFPEVLPHWIMNDHDPTLGQRVLDIGSGTGQLALWLQNQGFDVLCLDPSPVMVKCCRSKGLPCLQTTFQDYQNTKPFSIVLAILSFIHVPKKEWKEQLSKVANLLPPKGLFILALIEGEKEAIQVTSTNFSRFFAYFNREEVLKLTENEFELLNFHSYPSSGNSYLLFALRKR